jgi:hypothetical protein
VLPLTAPGQLAAAPHVELVEALQHDPNHQGPAGQAQQAAQQALEGARAGMLPGMLHVIHIVLDLK